MINRALNKLLGWLLRRELERQQRIEALQALIAEARAIDTRRAGGNVTPPRRSSKTPSH